jgi:hypothetical protein
MFFVNGHGDKASVKKGLCNTKEKKKISVRGSLAPRTLMWFSLNKNYIRPASL